MNKYIITYKRKLSYVFLIILTICVFFLLKEDAFATSGDTLWAKSTESGAPNYSSFINTAVDENDNIYVSGYIYSGTYNFGNSVTATGSYNSGSNALVVKYGSNGTPQWARTLESGAPNYSLFSDIKTDKNGNVYAVGYINGNSTFDFGNGVAVSGGYNSGANAVLVKYNTSGETQWARSTEVGAPRNSTFYTTTIDSKGNIYTAGGIYGNGTYDFGNGVTVSGGYSSQYNLVIIKYNSDGVAQWAKSTGTTTSQYSFIYNITLDKDENVIVVGGLFGNTIFDFGNGITASGGNGSNTNILLIKYDSSGNTLWARSTESGAPNRSIAIGVATDDSNNIFVVGGIRTNGVYSFGNGVSVSGGYAAHDNTVLLKYDSAGNALWAKSTGSGATNFSGYYEVLIDPQGSIYTVGAVGNNGVYDFGNGVTISGGSTTTNILLVKFDSSGNTVLAKSTGSGTSDFSGFYSIANDSKGDIYASGIFAGGTPYNFGNGVILTGGFSSQNGFLIKYEGDQIPQATAQTKIQKNDSPPNPNCINGWKHCIQFGNQFTGLPSFVNQSKDGNNAQIYIDKNTHHDDSVVKIEHKPIDSLISSDPTVPSIPFPWMQGYNIASPIWNIDIMSAFNGYSIPELDNPGIIQLQYEPTMLGAVSPKNLRIGYYDTATKRWRILPNNTVLNETNHTISNTTKVFGYMAVVYPRLSHTMQ